MAATLVDAARAELDPHGERKGPGGGSHGQRRKMHGLGPRKTRCLAGFMDSAIILRATRPIDPATPLGHRGILRRCRSPEKRRRFPWRLAIRSLAGPNGEPPTIGARSAGKPRAAHAHKTAIQELLFPPRHLPGLYPTDEPGARARRPPLPRRSSDTLGRDSDALASPSKRILYRSGNPYNPVGMPRATIRAGILFFPGAWPGP